MSGWMKKLAAGVVAILMLGVTACSQTPATTLTKEDKPLQPFTVMLDWYPNSVHTFLYVAKEKGYFKEAGLDVTLQPPSDANDPVKLVAAGQADVALSYMRQVVISRAQQIPVVSLAAIVRHPLNQLMVRADVGVNSPKDLVGKTIGYASSDLDVSLVKTMITSDGGDPEAVKFVDVGYDLIPAMLTKKVDGIIGGYINHEKLLIEKSGMALKTFSPSAYAAPNQYELVLITGEKTVKEKESQIRAFWAACQKAQAEVTADPDKALQTLLTAQMKEFPLDESVEKQGLQMLLPMMNGENVTFGAQEESEWKTLIDWMVANKHIEAPIKASDMFRNL